MVNFTLRPLYSRRNPPSVATAQKAGWAPQQIWTVLRRENSLGPAGWVLSRSSSQQPCHYTQYATRLPLDCHSVTLTRFLFSRYFQTTISHQNILRVLAAVAITTCTAHTFQMHSLQFYVPNWTLHLFSCWYNFITKCVMYHLETLYRKNPKAPYTTTETHLSLFVLHSAASWKPREHINS